MSKINDEGFLELSGIREQSATDDLTAAKFPVLDGLTPLSIRVLNQASHKMNVSKGVAVMNVGDTPHDLYFISKGSVSVVKKNSGALKVVAQLRAGDFYGEFGALRGKTRFASIYTAENSEIIGVDLKAIHQVLDADEAFRVRMDKLMRERMLNSFLFNHPAFESLPAQSRNALREHLRIVEVKRNDVLFKAGDASEHSYIVLSGEAAVSFHIGEKEVVFAIRRDNDVLGEVRSDNGTKYGYSVRAAHHLDLLILDKVTMNYIKETEPEAFAKLTHILAEQMKKTIIAVKNSKER